MRTSHLALSLLLVSCTVGTPNTAPTGPVRPAPEQAAATSPGSPGSPGSSGSQALSQPSRPVLRPSVPLTDDLQSATGRISSGTAQDNLSIQVVIQRPANTFRTQQLELSRIKNLRAWVEGPGLESRILNTNDFVTVADQNQQTQLVINQVPRGKHRVVTVQGYQFAEAGDPPEVAGATLKAVYSSPENSTEIVLTFTWRSTAQAEIIEALLARAEEAPTEVQDGDDTPTQAQILEYIDNLDDTALNAFLDAVIFGTNPTTGSTYQVHPDRLDPEKIAEIIVEQAGVVPTQEPTDPVPEAYLDNMADLSLKVQTPQKVPFTNSQIQVQITDPASIPVTLTVGSDTAGVPQVVPGTWEAVVKLDGLNGGVSTRATVEVDADGNVILTEGTDANPIILPPVITAIDKTSAGAGEQITLTGDGFDPDKTQNTVNIGGVEATVVSATATELVVEMPAGVSGTSQITVTSEGKTSNYAEVTAIPKITSLSSIAGIPGQQVTITVSGYDPSQVSSTVQFNGSTLNLTPDSVTENTLTVTVPVDATTGPITVTPTDLDPMDSQTYTIGIKPSIFSVNPAAIAPGQQLTVTGVNMGQVTSITINGSTVDPNSIIVVPGTNGNPDVVVFTVPDVVSDGDLRITTPTGVASTPVQVLQPPTITSLNPPDPAQPGSPLVIQGDNYLPVTEVSIGGVVLSANDYQIDDDGQITITNPPDNPVLGPVKVTNAAGSATASVTYKDVENFIGNANNALRTTKNYTFMNSPHGINVDGDGNIYVADLAGRIHKFLPDGTVPTGWPLGLIGAGYQDGAGSVARFSNVEDLANDAAGNIYLADTDNDAIRKITEVNGNIQVTTIARVPGPEGIEISREGKLYVTGNNPPNPSGTSPIIGSYVFRVDDLNTAVTPEQNTAYSRGNISTIANAQVIAGGPKATVRQNVTTNLQNSRFNHLEGLGIDGQGRIYVADVDHYWIRRIDEANDTVTVFADLNPCYFSTNCQFTLENPGMVAHEIRVDRQGNVFVPSVSAAPAVGVYLIDQTGKFSFVAGSATGFTGLNDGNPLSSATFSSPRAVDFGPDGSLYVADTSWGVRKIERYHPASNLQMP